MVGIGIQSYHLIIPILRVAPYSSDQLHPQLAGLDGARLRPGPPNCGAMFCARRSCDLALARQWKSSIFLKLQFLSDWV